MISFTHFLCIQLNEELQMIYMLYMIYLFWLISINTFLWHPDANW